MSRARSTTSSWSATGSRRHGAVIGTHGFYVDVTPSVRQAQELVTEAVSEIAESRGAIEQAKGMLMLIYGLSGDAAFDLLRWRSQEANVKLRLLAEQIIADFMTVRDEGDAGAALPAREAYDGLFLTAHQRVRKPERLVPATPGYAAHLGNEDDCDYAQELRTHARRPPRT